MHIIIKNKMVSIKTMGENMNMVINTIVNKIGKN